MLRVQRPDSPLHRLSEGFQFGGPASPVARAREVIAFAGGSAGLPGVFWHAQARQAVQLRQSHKRASAGQFQARCRYHSLPQSRTETNQTQAAKSCLPSAERKTFKNIQSIRRGVAPHRGANPPLPTHPVQTVRPGNGFLARPCRPPPDSRAPRPNPPHAAPVAHNGPPPRVITAGRERQTRPLRFRLWQDQSQCHCYLYDE